MRVLRISMASMQPKNIHACARNPGVYGTSSMGATGETAG